jgi:hypothetical protein
MHPATQPWGCREAKRSQNAQDRTRRFPKSSRSQPALLSRRPTVRRMRDLVPPAFCQAFLHCYPRCLGSRRANMKQRQPLSYRLFRYWIVSGPRCSITWALQVFVHWKHEQSVKTTILPDRHYRFHLAADRNVRPRIPAAGPTRPTQYTRHCGTINYAPQWSDTVNCFIG